MEVCMSANILIVEDDFSQSDLIRRLLKRKLGYTSISAANGQEALNIIGSDDIGDIKLVIMDLKMPVMDGMEALEIMRVKYPNLPVIMLSGSRDLEDAKRAVELGAIDFLNKPFDGERLKVTVQNALKLSELSSELKLLKNKTTGLVKFEDIIGHDRGLIQTVAYARKAAKADIQVLITGETGTGKEVFARAIHGESSRSGKPFIAINCAAIPAQLIESTLFGHEKGAFTSAFHKSLGKFREADGGTIFLDEIGDLPLESQVKLLRVLQQKEVEPVGAPKPIPVDVRIISATHQNLEQAVKNGKFREDLYFRLNVLKIEIPALKERLSDIPLLARYFMSRICTNEGILPKSFSKAADDYMMMQMWPGNVRQLENAVHRALVLCESNLIDANDLIIANNSCQYASDDHYAKSGLFINIMHDTGQLKTAEEIKDEFINLALNIHRQNFIQTAKAIGVSKSTLYNRKKEHLV